MTRTYVRISRKGWEPRRAFEWGRVSGPLCGLSLLITVYAAEGSGLL